MDTQIMSVHSTAISWTAPIIPCESLAGINLGTSDSDLKTLISQYLIDENELKYQFKDSPALRLSAYELDDEGNGGYKFSLFDSDLINTVKKSRPALSISIRDNKVTFLKVYDFSFADDAAQDFIYKGVLPGNIGLGDSVSDLAPLTELEIDESDEFFYTDPAFGEVEITGLGVPLEDEPDQPITAICVIPGKKF
ncbi:hypothetical protein [Pseudomonas syringae group genomosp. 3]|uniref:hypothetical protein n=1 Tax=Pseudomonas syringae group genomosp. 3 TaxID=251701 RepID=UPI00217F6F82|nr:hypothetical protein [Pseudomonas syringae group genomosp. 3]